MNESVDLSIVIVSYNTKRLLEQCLDSLFENLSGCTYEVFVVDNASKDASPDMVKEKFQQVKLISNEQNKGFAAANNQAIRTSQGKFILLLNSDTIVLPDALSRMMSFLQGHPDVGVVGCKLSNPDGTLQPSAYGRPSLFKEFFHITQLDGLVASFDAVRRVMPAIFLRTFPDTLARYNASDRIREVSYVSGSCFMIKRQVIDEIGLLDESFFIYHEEMEWCYRARKKGWRIVYYPEAEIIHYGAQSASQLGPRIFYERYRGLLYFYRKHYGLRQTLFLRIMVLSGLFARICLLLLRNFLKPVERFGEEYRVYADLTKLYLG